MTVNLTQTISDAIKPAGNIQYNDLSLLNALAAFRQNSALYFASGWSPGAAGKMQTDILRQTTQYVAGRRRLLPEYESHRGYIQKVVGGIAGQLL